MKTQYACVSGPFRNDFHNFRHRHEGIISIFVLIITFIFFLYFSLIVLPDRAEAVAAKVSETVPENTESSADFSGNRIREAVPAPFEEKDPTEEIFIEDWFVKEETGIFTAYTSSRRETDSSPFITADGTDLRKTSQCVIANNSLDFGTLVEIESIGLCTVKDRMNRRYKGHHFDIYMGTDRNRALEFGRRKLKYRIAEYN